MAEALSIGEPLPKAVEVLNQGGSMGTGGGRAGHDHDVLSTEGSIPPKFLSHQSLEPVPKNGVSHLSTNRQP